MVVERIIMTDKNSFIIILVFSIYFNECFDFSQVYELGKWFHQDQFFIFMF